MLPRFVEDACSIVKIPRIHLNSASGVGILAQSPDFQPAAFAMGASWVLRLCDIVGTPEPVEQGQLAATD